MRRARGVAQGAGMNALAVSSLGGAAVDSCVAGSERGEGRAKGEGGWPFASERASEESFLVAARALGEKVSGIGKAPS